MVCTRVCVLCAYMHKRVRTCTRVYVHVQECTYMYKSVRAYARVCVHMQECACITRVHAYARVYVHVGKIMSDL